MPKAGQQAREQEGGGLEDRICVGVLARAFPRELVDEVIDLAGRGSSAGGCCRPG